MFVSFLKLLISAIVFISIAGCISTEPLPGNTAYDPCRGPCAEIDSMELPSCVLKAKARRKWREANEAICEDILKLEGVPRGSCGCFKAVITEKGQLTNIEAVYTENVENVEMLVRQLGDLAFEVPQEAQCIVGVALPFNLAVE